MFSHHFGDVAGTIAKEALLSSSIEKVVQRTDDLRRKQNIRVLS